MMPTQASGTYFDNAFELSHFSVEGPRVLTQLTKPHVKLNHFGIMMEGQG